MLHQLSDRYKRNGIPFPDTITRTFPPPLHNFTCKATTFIIIELCILNCMILCRLHRLPRGRGSPMCSWCCAIRWSKVCHVTQTSDLPMIYAQPKQKFVERHRIPNPNPVFAATLPFEDRFDMPIIHPYGKPLHHRSSIIHECRIQCNASDA